MPLAAGMRLGPYEVLGLIGAGGMGEVYKARDTRLDRTVAIKVLPTELSADPERRARFEREARTIAGLNHPHICTLYDVGEHVGSTYLVMEYLAGETLAARLDKGRLPLGQALSVAVEIADALAAAHRQGVIHRDLKPGNVLLTKTGAKLLDFGLAKLMGHGEQPAAAYAAPAPPTQAAPLTGQGVIVGTVQYMAPEQLEAKPADARTDLWAFGAIVYEMVTGKRAFEGPSTVSLMGAILEREPTPIASLQPATPAALDRLVRRCLAKDPDERWDSAHDVAYELRWMAEELRRARTPTGGPLDVARGALAVKSAQQPIQATRGEGSQGSPGAFPEDTLLVLVARSQLTITSGISYLVFKTSDEIVKAVSDAARHFPRNSDDVFYINQGGGEITIICDADHENLVASVRYQAFDDRRPVGVLRIREIQDDTIPRSVEVPGFYAYFIGLLADNGINILDVISGGRELALVLAEGDLTAAFALLTDRIRECRRQSDV